MDKILRILFSCLIPISLAVLCVVAVPLVVGEKINCSETDVLYPRDRCLSEIGEFLVDVLRYGGLVLFLVGIVLPIIVGSRSKSQKMPSIST
jgi:hypothetical protein